MSKIRWVNMHQTKEERREKYRLAREHGANSYQARVVRDWTMPHLKLFLEAIKDYDDWAKRLNI